MTFQDFMKSGYTKSLIAFCAAYQLSGCGSSGGSGSVTIDLDSASFSWAQPTEREDGTLLGGDIAGYRVYYGLTSGDYQREIDINEVSTFCPIPCPTVTVGDLPVGETYFFVLTTYDTEGRESVYSQEVEISI